MQNIHNEILSRNRIGTVLDENGNRVRPDIEKPQYDQRTYFGRSMHFFQTTNPINLFATPVKLDNAKNIVSRYRNGEDLNITEKELWKNKILYDSAFHPDTGEKMVLIGRMSAQVPMNALITGGMLTFYKNRREVIMMQWLNQSFMAIVNYTNRSGSSTIPQEVLGAAYVGATFGSVGAALSFNVLAQKLPPIFGRLVPFIAVAAGNAINIPVMRNAELREGSEILTEDGVNTGLKSVNAAQNGLGMVFLSRIAMATPGMVGIPFVMNKLQKKGTLKRYPWLPLPLQMTLAALILSLSTPLGCALFTQKATIHVDKLECNIQNKLKEQGIADYVCYNKGL